MTRTRIPLRDRLFARIALPDATGCMLWMGTTARSGYGVLGTGGRGEGLTYAHRAVYELLVGPIPEGLHIDHLCRVRSCCNPSHLEPVTQQENNRRAVAAKPLATHCSNGHEWTPENTRQTARQRRCRTCTREQGLRSVAS